MKNKLPLEHEIQSAILDYLNLIHVMAWRCNTGAIKLGNRYVRFGKKGMADILGILPNGKLLAIECKRPGGRMTLEQEQFINDIKENNGVAFMADSLDTVMRLIK